MFFFPLTLPRALHRHPKLPCKNGIVNKAGLTPLTLACKLGRSEVFREMLELSCREFWRYSNITCSAYPLNALDTIQPDGSTSMEITFFVIKYRKEKERKEEEDIKVTERHQKKIVFGKEKIV